MVFVRSARKVLQLLGSLSPVNKYAHPKDHSLSKVLLDKIFCHHRGYVGGGGHTEHTGQTLSNYAFLKTLERKGYLNVLYVILIS